MLLVSRAKRSLRAGSGGHSTEAQSAFRLAMTQTIGGFALFLCLLLTMLSAQTTRIALTPTEPLSPSLLVVAIALIIFSIGSLVRIMRGPGQGGALLEDGSSETPLTGGLADNEHWYLGMICVDREGPSIMLECRFGIGYPMNLGNGYAVLFLTTYMMPLFALIGLALAGVVS